LRGRRQGDRAGADGGYRFGAAGRSGRHSGPEWRAAWALAPVALSRHDITRSLTPYSAAALWIGVPDMATVLTA